MFQQALAQVREVAVGITGGGDTLVHLDHVHTCPRHVFVCERAEHLPRGLAAADRHHEPPARDHGRPRLGRDDPGGLLRRSLGVGEDAELHHFAGFSWCPPNWKRMADSTLFWKSASPRDEKRS